MNNGYSEEEKIFIAPMLEMGESEIIMDMIEKLKKEIEETKKEMLLAMIFFDGKDRSKINLCKEVIAQNERLISMLESRKK